MDDGTDIVFSIGVKYLGIILQQYMCYHGVLPWSVTMEWQRVHPIFSGQRTHIDIL